MTKQEIGQILRAAREAKGLTQKQVATEIGRKQQVVGHWETGYAQPDANTLFELCDLYGISVDEAFGKKKADGAAISAEAQSIARAFDYLDAPGRAAVRAVLETQRQRVAEYGPLTHKAAAHHGKQIPVIVGTNEAEIQMKYQSMREVEEMEEIAQTEEV